MVTWKENILHETGHFRYSFKASISYPMLDWVHTQPLMAKTSFQARAKYVKNQYQTEIERHIPKQHWLVQNILLTETRKIEYLI